MARARSVEDRAGEVAQEGVTEEQIDALEAQTRARVEDAVQAALQSPYPDPASERATEYRP